MDAGERPRRARSIRALLAALFVVPLVSLLALWVFAASVTLSNAIQEHNFNSENQRYGGWAQTLFTQLAQERLQSFEWLSTGGHMSRAPMDTQRIATDKAVTAFWAGMSTSPIANAPNAKPALMSLNRELRQLKSTIRPAIDAVRISPLAAFEAYNAVIDAQFQLYSKLIVVNNASLYQQAQASVLAGRAVEMASREASLITGALVNGGQMNQGERVLLAQTAADQRLLMSDALKELNPSLGSGFQRTVSSSEYASFTAIETKITDSIGKKAPLHLNALAFAGASFGLFKGFQAAEGQDRMALANQGTAVGNQLLLQVLLAGGAGLVAVALSIFLMAWFGRRINRDLTGLQGSALELANDQLPRVVERLSHGEDIDAAAEAGKPAASAASAARIVEIRRVADAFASVQRTAVEAAVGQAKLRKGVSQVFRNLAWRSQALLHRQLAMLDGMERRTSDPETLEELYQIDHLTTRMRRHAEGLIILSGAAPGRGWRDPVPVMDVVRGAIAEVEDYARINIIKGCQDALVGSAVADVIHLLAEFMENAATCSPTSTEVTVKAERVANGVVVEIEDRGLGMTDDDFTAANERLANPPEFDLAESDKLGFFVVARLASRHRIKITLRPSPYGGTSAIVLLPHAIVVAQGDLESEIDATLRRVPLPARIVGNGPVAAVADVAGAPQPLGDGTGHSLDSGAALSLGNGEGQPMSDAGAQPAHRDSDSADTSPALPWRVRQASLAPQLKESASPRDGDAKLPSATEGRSPAEIRAFVASMQQGWQGGRGEATQPDDS